MVESYNIIITALNQLVIQLFTFLPKLIITLAIWWIGLFLVDLGIKLIKKIDIKKTKIDNKVIDVFSSIIYFTGRIILVLIILDYWGIGQTIISALANGLTITFAIALGLAFGKALEPEAREVVEILKKKIESRK